MSNVVTKGGIAVANATRLDDPGALGGVLTGISFIGGLATGLSLADAPFPRPGTDLKDVQRFFQGDAGPERINVGGQLLSTASPAVFSASVARLAGRGRRGSRALQAMAIAGGALASLSLAASAPPRPRSPPVLAGTRTGPGRCTASCSPPVGRCTARGWRCCWARSVWPDGAPGPCHGR
jgi:hypothetical protein